jgi:hypothetical protein
MTSANEANEFSALPRFVQLQLVAVEPGLLGAVCGFLIGLTAVGYWALTAVAIGAGVVSGIEHARLRSASGRGLAAGIAFGFGLSAAHAVDGAAPLVEIPSPAVLLVPISGACRAGLSVLGSTLSRWF